MQRREAHLCTPKKMVLPACAGRTKSLGDATDEEFAVVGEDRLDLEVHRLGQRRDALAVARVPSVQDAGLRIFVGGVAPDPLRPVPGELRTGQPVLRNLHRLAGRSAGEFGHQHGIDRGLAPTLRNLAGEFVQPDDLAVVVVCHWITSN